MTDPRSDLGGELVWQASNGHWIELNLLYAEVSTRNQVLRKVAESVVVGRHEVPLPAVFTGVPKSYTMSSATFDRLTVDGKKWWSLNVNYAAGPGAYFSTSVSPDGEPPRPPGAPSRPAGERQKPPACRVENGTKACLDTSGPAVGLDEVGGPDGWVNRIRLLGPDETKWTTEVLP